MEKKKIILTEKQLESLKDSFNGYKKIIEKIIENKKEAIKKDTETE